MSNIPKDRAHLIKLVEGNFDKLSLMLDDLSDEGTSLVVTDDLTIKDILAIRLWWCEAVLMWIAVGQDGNEIELPAEGYSWQETPILNQDIANMARSIPLKDIVGELTAAVKEVLRVIDTLSDQELCEVDMFHWTGKWPVMRWISVNTSSQFEEARKMIAKAKKANNQ